MKFSLPIFLSTLALTRGNDLRSTRRKLRNTDATECTIQVAVFLEINPGSMGQDDISFECEMDGADTGLTVPIKATKEQKKEFKKMLDNGNLIPGKSTLSHGRGVPFNDSGLFIPPGLEISKSVGQGKKNGLNKRNGRRLATNSMIGQKPILAVRVVDVNGKTHPHDVTTMSNNIFGNGVDNNTLKSVLEDCSMGKLEIVPGEIDGGNGNDATGMIEVTIPIDMTVASSNAEIHNAAKQQVANRLGINVNDMPGPFQQIMFNIEACYTGDCGWAAYAYINSWMSVYQGNYYYMPGVQVHELGHNFGFAHSGGLDGQTYTDHTGMMGNPLYKDDNSRMCYNAAKNWNLAKDNSSYSWYSDRKLLINPRTENNGNGYTRTFAMVGIADYLNNPAALPVVTKLETGTSDDFFIGFNRAIGVNADNDEADNEITIVKTGANGEAYSQSFLQATLVQGESYTIENFGGSGKPVTITALEINLASNPAVATIDMRYDAGSPPTCTELGMKDASVTILTDNYPQETSWQITVAGTNDVTRSGSGYSVAGETYTEDICLANGNYVFTINDAYSDGICCGYGSGSYSVSVEGVQVAQGGQFGSSESTPFTVGGAVTMAPTQAPTAIPTKSPTPNPTVAPTSAPSRSPTSSPTAAPTKSPTPNPTLPPTNPPSPAPTSSPTAAPTKSPTPNPTLPPTNPPSPAPTSSPTAAPTKSPTPNPTLPPTNPPSHAPTSSPTASPTVSPTSSPTSSPTVSQGCDLVQVEILTDNYPGETSWQLTDATSTIVLSGNGYTSSGTTFTDEICVDDWTSLSFTINDAYGDGICCSYGSGSYTVRVNGVGVLSGGAFGSSETKPLQPESCTYGEETVGNEVVCKCAPGEMRVGVDVLTDRYPSETTWTLSTCDGVEVDAGSYSNRSTQHNDSICVASNRAYRFQINDSYGDGICCSYGQGNYQLRINGLQVHSSTGDFGGSETKDINGVCSSNIVVSDPPIKCSSVAKKQDCNGNCQWVGNGNNGKCELRPKEEPTPKCEACRSTGTSCCGTCVNNGPKWMRGCY